MLKDASSSAPRDLTESLEQQTATSEVLQVISSSPGDLQPVFTAMLANATRICEAKFGNLLLSEEGAFRAVAWHGEPTYVENWRREPLVMVTDDLRIPLARLIQTKQPIHVADLRTEPAYRAGFDPLVTLVDKGGARTLLIVPMLKETSLWEPSRYIARRSDHSREADRTDHEFCRSGGHRHREYATAERASRTH